MTNLPSLNIYELFNEQAILHPNKTAVVYQDQRLTYQQVNQQVLSLSFHLSQLGVTKGSHIAIFSNNNNEFATILLSLAQLGAVAVALPLTLKSQARRLALKTSDIEFVIGWFNIIKQLHQDISFNCKAYISLSQRVNDFPFYDDLIKESLPFKTSYLVEQSLPYILTLTSGSTGQPKPIIFTQKTKIIRSIIATKEVYNLGTEDIILVSTPLYHSLAQRSLLLPLMLGATAVILPKFTALGWIQAVTKEKVSFLFAVSSQLDILLKEDTIGLNNFSFLKTIISSSSLLKNSSKELLVKLFNVDIHECYGASEVGVVTDLSLSSKQNKMGSVGQALPHVKIKLDPKTHEILCKSKTEFLGYYKQEKKTNESYTLDHYFKTGDIGFIDNDDYLYYKGRLKDIIITGGINVYPQDIEIILNSIDGIKESAVIGLDDDYFGEIVVAILVEEECNSIDLKIIRKICMKKLIDYQLPQRYEIVDQLPKTSLGKVIKKELLIKFNSLN